MTLYTRRRRPLKITQACKVLPRASGLADINQATFRATRGDARLRRRGLIFVLQHGKMRDSGFFCGATKIYCTGWIVVRGEKVPSDASCFAGGRGEVGQDLVAFFDAVLGYQGKLESWIL